MAKLTNECIQKLNTVPLHRLISCDGHGATKYAKCPRCGAEGKKKGKQIGLHVVDDDVKNKHLLKCHSCDFKAGGGTINIMREYNEMDFRAACEYIAKETGIELEEEEKAPKKVPKTDEGSFCSRQLAASGLTFDDVRAKVIVGDDILQLSPFRRGSLNIYTGEIDEYADEMLILYYDLEGRRRKVIPAKARSREVDYTRVRWSNPEAHVGKRGKAPKYQSIYGAKTALYIPQYIRALYQARKEFDTLFIQEGEKKAEKACKHHIPSIAIQGIEMIGSKEEGLPAEIQYLVQRCNIKNIVMVMDSDWDDLNRKLADGDWVEERPRNFARALIKFRKYVGTLARCSIDVDIWFAHVNKNEAGDKGLDDLLCNTLKDSPDTLVDEIRNTMLSHDGKGEHLDCFNVTSYSDTKIMTIWDLGSKDDFFARHEDRLLQLKTFQFGGVFYKVVDGKIQVSTEFGSGKAFWSVSYDKEKKKIDIDLLEMLSFLTANGFRTIRTEDGKRAFIKIERGVIEPRDEYDLRNFVLNYVYKATKDHAVHLSFAETISSRLSSSNLCQLELLETNAGKPTKDAQRFYYKDAQVEITAKDIEVGVLKGPVWKDNLIGRSFSRERIFETFEPDGNGSFRIVLTPAGEECELLTYILHTSNSHKDLTMNAKEISEYLLHVANKVTCLGYLLRDYKYMSEAKAVVAMDGTMSEVGFSAGRSGKSLLAKAISKMLSQAEIDGRNLSNDDQYMFSEVTRTTKNIFIDDINPGVDIGRFFQRITGKLNVNIKQGARFYIDFDEAPKFYITTNHAIDNIDDSAKARLIFLSFSNWYTGDYTVIQEFGHEFFADWDERQWQLFDNLLCECVMYYLRSREKGWAGKGVGAIDPPMADLRRRALRQEMGEQFLQWADLYFAVDGGHINKRIVRKDMFENYLNDYKQKATKDSAQTFRKKIHAFCKFKGYHFNPTKRNNRGQWFNDFIVDDPQAVFIGERDTANSMEFYTIATTEYLTTNKLSIE